MKSGFLPSWPLTRVNASVISYNNNVLHLYRVVYSSEELKKLYKHYLIKSSQPPCEAGNDKRDYP